MRVHQETDKSVILTDFLKDPNLFFQKTHVCACVSSEYPLLFMQKVCAHVEKDLGAPVRILDISTSSARERAWAQLAMSLLGQEFLYFLGDVSSVKSSEQSELFTKLSGYSGPHRVIFFSREPVKGIPSVNIPANLNTRDYENFLLFWPAKEHEKCRHAIQKICAKTGVLSLEQAVRVTEYSLVLGGQRTSFLNNWVNSLVKPESSLFDLSSALFAKDGEKFWALWQTLSADYEFPFWLAYFSDQFFRAYFFVLYKQENNHELARKIGYKLPFSFIQRDYKKHTPEKLLQAHTRLCELDHHLKTGGSSVSLESVFTPFF